MTKKEYEELHRTARDFLNHTLKVGDLVAAVFCNNVVNLAKVIKICPKRIIVARITRDRQPIAYSENTMIPSRVIKIKEDGIPED